MLRATLAALLLAAATLAQSPIVTTVVNNGSTQTRYDLVFLGDGYQATERNRFDADVNACVTSMMQRPPYSNFATYFNIHSVFRASQDSGATHPDANPPIFRNTAYGASYNTSGVARCLYITNETQAYADAALAPATEGRTIVLVNDGRYGGCASQFAVSYNGPQMPDVQVHEIGHSLGGLADEYDYPNNTYTGGEPGQANITANPAAAKWSHWFGTDNIGAFEGAGYYLHGLWRPRNDCLMRSLGVTLCSVCREQISRAINASVTVIDQPSPASTTVFVSQPQPQTFSFTNIVPAANNPVIEWAVDGQVVPGVTGTSFTINSGTMTMGPHTVRVTVRDQTPLVRLDPSGLLREVRTWNVQVSDPNAAELSIPTLSVSQPFVDAGQSFNMTTRVANAGPATATGARVEWFLSTDNIIQTTDIFLGEAILPAIAPGLQASDVRSITMPALIDVRYYYLIAVVDRTNQILESNDQNNTRLNVVIVQHQDCVPRLEYRDDLHWPRDQGAIQMSAGGTLLPTVVARCSAGQLYVIAWTASGTSPGTPLTPSLTIPLNQDGLTQIGLSIANGAMLQSFVGVLDAQGVGRATLSWPAGLMLPPAATNFAAALVDASGFASVTNPIGFDLR